MNQDEPLQRFIAAQQRDYTTALAEIKSGGKRSHWMWYIFPQIQGLGFSETSRYYAIKNKAEAKAYLSHPVLGNRLTEISKAVFSLPGSNARTVFGSPDDLKLHSCITLFASLPEADAIFDALLDKYFGGEKDEATLRILRQKE